MSDYDIIIVGAGPGGSTAAKYAAEKGLKAIMFERSAIPGQKNCSGTALSPKVFRDFKYLKPDLGLSSVRISKMATAHLIDENLEEKTFFGFSASSMAKYPEARDFLTVNAYRAELDPYLADLAVNSGAELKTSSKITDVLRGNDGRIIGVIDENKEKYYGKIVLGADGVISTIAEKSGLRKRWHQNDLTLMVTIDFEASKEKIDRVFANNALHYWFSAAFPVAYSFFHGTGVHVGLGHFINAWDKSPNYYLERFLQTPALKQQLELVEGKPREYQAHLLTFVQYPTHTYSTDGVLLIGDAAGFPCPLEAEGIYYAMLSGKIAVDVAEEYINTGEPAKLKSYEIQWQHSPIGEEFELGTEIYHFIRKIPFSMEAAKWLVPFINNLIYSLVNVGESHTYNLANFAPNLINDYRVLPLILKYIAPAIPPLTERYIENQVNKKLISFIPDSVKPYILRFNSRWKAIKRKLSEFVYRIINQT